MRAFHIVVVGVVAVAVSVGVLGLGASLARRSVTPQLAAAEDPVKEWDSRWTRAIKDAAKGYQNLAKWCEAKDLQATSLYIRRRVFRYLPDDEETRKYYGYEKQGSTWVMNDIRRDEIRSAVDIDDPRQTAYQKQLDSFEKKIAGWFRSLAKTAEKNGTEDPSTAAGWKEKAGLAWERVLELDRDNEEAHKALGHPKFEGKYCSPFKLKYIEARTARKRSGEKTAATSPAVEPVEADGLIVAAGLQAGGAKSETVVVNTTHGKEVALRLAQSWEKAIADVLEMYGFDASVKGRLNYRKVDIVKDQPEFRQFLEKGAKWNAKEIQRHIDAGFGGTTVAAGEQMFTHSAGVDADDGVMNLCGLAMAYAARDLAVGDIGSPNAKLEDWLWQSMGYDVTKRVLGTNLTVWGAFGRYGQNVHTRPGEDLWIELARRQVEADDDVAISRLWRLELVKQEFKGPETVKGYALLQFVFERGPAEGQKFVWYALAQGTPAACMAIFPDSADQNAAIERAEAEYREWILKAW